MACADAILAAVQRIHEAPLALDGWTRAMPAIAALFASQQTCFRARDARGQAVECINGYGLLPADFVSYRAVPTAGHFPQQWQTLSTGMTARRSTMWPNQEFIRSTYYNEVVRLWGSFHTINTPLVSART